MNDLLKMCEYYYNKVNSAKKTDEVLANEKNNNDQNSS